MTRTRLSFASILIVLAMLLAGYWAGEQLPADLRLPVHWDLSGNPDRLAGKWEALLMPAAIVGAVSLLFFFLPKLEPRRENFDRSRGLYLWGWVGLLLFGVAMEIALLSIALGWGIPANHLLVGAMGMLLVLIGNQLGKSRSMYLIGLRTPWTLASEEVWIRTHRLAGKLMVAAGLLLFVAAWLPLPSGLLASLAMGAIGIAAVVPIVYSFLLWKRESRGAGAANGQDSSSV